MKLALSNIALPEFDHTAELDRVSELGIEGLEVSPSRVWRDWWHELTPTMVESYRRSVERAGLRVVGLHTLFWRQDHLGLFKGAEATTETLDYLEHLSGVCRDLGGTSLVFGSGRARMRGERTFDQAASETVEVFGTLSSRIADHGTFFAFEALGQNDSDFINSVVEALVVVDRLGSPTMRTHLDAKALVQADEVNQETFERAAPTAAHYHANEPDLGVLSIDGEVEHARLGDLLRGIAYDGYVSIEQRQVSAENPMDDIARSAEVLRACYAQ